MQVWNARGLVTSGDVPTLHQNLDVKLEMAGLQSEGRDGPQLIGLVETWIPSSSDALWAHMGIPARWVRESLGARPSPVGGRASGGLALFADPSLGLRREHNDSTARTDCALWASIPNPTGSPGARLYIAIVYFPDQEYFKDHWRLFTASVASFQHRGSILILGDFNAYTGLETDHVPRPVAVGPQWQKDLLQAAPLPLRQTSDQAPANARGQSLCALCRDLHLLILNGRASGDVPAALTTAAKTNQTGHVVDYAVVDEALWPWIERLEVLQDHFAIPAHLATAASDHAALRLCLRCTAPPAPATPAPAPAPPLHRGQPTFPHRLGPRAQLLSAATSAAVIAKLTALTAEPLFPSPGPHTLVEVEVATQRFQSVLVAAAVEAGARHSTRPRLPPRRKASPAAATPAPRAWVTPAFLTAAAVRSAADRVVSKLEKRVSATPDDAPLRVQLAQAQDARRLARRQCESEARIAREAFRRRRAEAFVDALVGDPFLLWKRKAGPASACPCSPEEQRTHFERVVNPAAAAQPPAAPVPGPAPVSARPTLAALDGPPTLGEVTAAVRSLKLNKAADSSGISGELLRGPGPEGDDRVEAVVAALTPLLQAFYTSGLPPSLTAATLVPIYKGKGDRTSMDSYRGIALMALLAKVYAVVLTTRLTTVLEKEGLRSDLQFGFRPKRGTGDAAFVLQALVDKYVRSRQFSPKHSHLYVAFVDFSKAFDMVPRDKLWARLDALGVRGPFLEAVKLYYQSVLFRVNTAEGLSETFEANSGVKQGCPLSPVLFGCFIESLVDGLEHADVPQLDGTSVPSILYADDTTLVSRSRAGLQVLLDRLAAFCSSQGMQVNEGKTKVMIFRNGNKPPKIKDEHALKYNGTPLEIVDEFKFLGLPLFANQTKAYQNTARVLSTSAAKSYRAMWLHANDMGIEDYPSLLKLFDACVLSVAGYNAPVVTPFLSDLDWRKPDPAEELHLRFLRAALGVPKWTPKTMLYLETDRVPLRYTWLHRASSYARRLANLPPTCILHRALCESLRLPVGWAQQLYRQVTALSQPPGTGPEVPLSLTDFVTKVTARGSTLPNAGVRALRERHRSCTTSMHSPQQPRPYFTGLFPRHRELLVVTAEGAPLASAPYLRQVASLPDRSLLAGLRMLPSVRGVNVGIPDVDAPISVSSDSDSGSDSDDPAPTPAAPLAQSPTDVPGLIDLCCPGCHRASMSYDHALRCPKLAAERKRFDLAAGLSLRGCLLNSDRQFLGKLCGFIRLIRGQVVDPARKQRRVWRGGLEAFPPVVRPDPEPAAPPEDPAPAPLPAPPPPAPAPGPRLGPQELLIFDTALRMLGGLDGLRRRPVPEETLLERMHIMADRQHLEVSLPLQAVEAELAARGWTPPPAAPAPP